MTGNYEQDFYSWTREQADLLRKGDFAHVDIDNLIEEVEAMGRSERNALKSQVARLLLYILKWEYQPERRSRSWQHSIRDAQIEIEENLRENPGLKPQVGDIFLEAYSLARKKAGNETGLMVTTFPQQCPYSLEEAQTFDP